MYLQSKESIKDPRFLVALPFCLLAIVVGASFAVSLTKETIDHLKELRELLQLKKDIFLHMIVQIFIDQEQI